MSIAALSPERASDLAELGPIKCEACPEKAVRAALWQIAWETVGHAIGGRERRVLVCPVCLSDAMDYALAMNVGITPPVVSRISVPTTADLGSAA